MMPVFTKIMLTVVAIGMAAWVPVMLIAGPTIGLYVFGLVPLGFAGCLIEIIWKVL